MQPTRPPTVPGDAQWQEKEQTWVQGAMLNGAHVGVWSAWRADGTPLYRAPYSPRFPGALHGDVETFEANGTVHQLDRYHHGKHVGSRLVSDGQLSRAPFISGEVSHARTEGGARHFWQAWLEDSVTLVVRSGEIDVVANELRTEYENASFAQKGMLKAQAAAAELGFSDEAEAEAKHDPVARSELEALAEKHTVGTRKEKPAATVKRLKRFLAAAKSAGWSKLPKLTGPKPWTPSAMAKAKKALGVTLPAGVQGALKEAGALVLSSNYLSLRVAASPDELDYDTEVGRVHDSPDYANLYGFSKARFNAKTVEKNFARLALTSYVFDDDDHHEDGDVGLIVVNRASGPAAPEGVWEMPHDDGYEHQLRATTVEGFFSWVVDRAIRCVALHAVADD